MFLILILLIFLFIKFLLDFQNNFIYNLSSTYAEHNVKSIFFRKLKKIDFLHLNLKHMLELTNEFIWCINNFTNLKKINLLTYELNYLIYLLS